jgi:hypothetical protein
VMSPRINESGGTVLRQKFGRSWRTRQGRWLCYALCRLSLSIVDLNLVQPHTKPLGASCSSLRRFGNRRVCRCFIPEIVTDLSHCPEVARLRGGAGAMKRG